MKMSAIQICIREMKWKIRYTLTHKNCRLLYLIHTESYNKILSYLMTLQGNPVSLWSVRYIHQKRFVLTNK